MLCILTPGLQNCPFSNFEEYSNIVRFTPGPHMLVHTSTVMAEVADFFSRPQTLAGILLKKLPKH